MILTFSILLFFAVCGIKSSVNNDDNPSDLVKLIKILNGNTEEIEDQGWIEWFLDFFTISNSRDDGLGEFEFCCGIDNDIMMDNGRDVRRTNEGSILCICPNGNNEKECLRFYSSLDVCTLKKK